MQATATADVEVINGGSVFSFVLLTEQAREWVRANVEAEPWQWMGSALVVEHGYARDLAAGMQADGLLVE